MCRVFDGNRLLERAEAGEFRLRSTVKPKTKPMTDYKGRLCVSNEETLILDDRFPISDPRHEVARFHRHITDSGGYGASEKPDPKDIVIENTNYRGIGPRLCELCESGDMIPPEERFFLSIYRPTVRES